MSILIAHFCLGNSVINYCFFDVQDKNGFLFTVLEEQPGMSFTRVAQQLQNQWRDLNEEERKMYEQVTVVSKVSKKASPAKSQQTLFSYLNRQPDIEVEVTLKSLKETLSCYE